MDCASPHLVFIGRANAAPGGADGEGAGSPAFAMAVEVLIDGEDQRDVLGDLEILRRNLDALGADLFDLLHQVVGVEHHAVADHRELARPHDS